MDRTLREHISHLEERLQLLGRQIKEDWLTPAESNRIQTEIRAAEMALTHYRKVLELEQQIR